MPAVSFVRMLCACLCLLLFCGFVPIQLQPVLSAQEAPALAPAPSPGTAPVAPRLHDPAPSTDAQVEPAKNGVPQRVYDVLSAIQNRKGEPLPGYIGGRRFENRERRLPRGHYREYDVKPKIPGKNRGAERLVIEQRTGKAYYTRDHYRTFKLMN